MRTCLSTFALPLLLCASAGAAPTTVALLPAPEGPDATALAPLAAQLATSLSGRGDLAVVPIPAEWQAEAQTCRAAACLSQLAGALGADLLLWPDLLAGGRGLALRAYDRRGLSGLRSVERPGDLAELLRPEALEDLLANLVPPGAPPALSLIAMGVQPAADGQPASLIGQRYEEPLPQDAGLPAVSATAVPAGHSRFWSGALLGLPPPSGGSWLTAGLTFPYGLRVEFGRFSWRALLLSLATVSVGLADWELTPRLRGAGDLTGFSTGVLGLGVGLPFDAAGTAQAGLLLYPLSYGQATARQHSLAATDLTGFGYAQAFLRLELAALVLEAGAQLPALWGRQWILGRYRWYQDLPPVKAYLAAGW